MNIVSWVLNIDIHDFIKCFHVVKVKQLTNLKKFELKTQNPELLISNAGSSSHELEKLPNTVLNFCKYLQVLIGLPTKCINIIGEY